MPWILGNSDAEHQCRREEGFDMHCRWDKGAGRIVETNVGKLSIEECAYKQVEEQVSVAATKYPSLILSSQPVRALAASQALSCWKMDPRSRLDIAS
jgi:hypothetical protein